MAYSCSCGWFGTALKYGPEGLGHCPDCYAPFVGCISQARYEQLVAVKSVPVENTATHYMLIFDGGAKGNPGPAYGSYQITVDGKPLPVRRREFGIATNNVAEYRALIEGLKELVHDVQAGKLCTIEVSGDSQLVIRQLKGEYKVRDSHLRLLCAEALALLGEFGGYTLTWKERSNSVAVLGH
jgi:ribonuclease HI